MKSRTNDARPSQSSRKAVASGGLKAFLFLLALVPATAANDGTAADNDALEAIRHCRDFIRKAQLDDGAFRVTIKDDAVRIWPYFGNVGACALLAAHKLEPQPDDLARVRRWLDWYANHMRDDGMIPDFDGTIRSYAPSPKRDSIDVYPPTYLAALWRYHQTQAGGISPEEMRRRAELSLHAVELALDPSDNLTWSSVPHRYKYPMDNMDVCIGLVEGAQLFESLGDRERADRCRQIVKGTSAAIAKLWLADAGHFAWIKGTSPKTKTFENPYPDGVANIYLAAHIDPPQTRLWENLRRQFGSAPRITPDLWLAAARRCATPEQIKAYTADAIKEANSDHLNLQTASRLLLALAGEAAPPVVIPMNLTRSGGKRGQEPFACRPLKGCFAQKAPDPFSRTQPRN
jgi:hypothetical protein